MSERDQGGHRSPVLMIVFIIRRANQKIKKSKTFLRNRPKIIFTHSSHFLWPSTKNRNKKNKSIHKAEPPLPPVCLPWPPSPLRQQQIGFVAPSIFILILSAEFVSIYCENVKETEKSPCPAPFTTLPFFRLCLLCPFLILLHFLASPSSSPSSLSSSLRRRHPPPICTLWTPNQVTRTRSLLDLYGKYFYTRQPQPRPLPPPTATPAVRQWKSFFLHFCPFFCWLAKCESPRVSLGIFGAAWLRVIFYIFFFQADFLLFSLLPPRLLPPPFLAAFLSFGFCLFRHFLVA